VLLNRLKQSFYNTKLNVLQLKLSCFATIQVIHKVGAYLVQHYVYQQSISRVVLNSHQLSLYLKLSIFVQHKRQTTRECVYLVRGDHFRSRDKDGGHNIRSAISENPIPHGNEIYERGVCDNTRLLLAGVLFGVFDTITEHYVIIGCHEPIVSDKFLK